MVYQVCFDTELPLRKCLLTAHNNGPGNSVTHMQRRHTREEVPLYWKHVEAKDQATVESTLPTGKEFFGVQSTMDLMSSADVANKAEKLLYRFFNTANVAMNQTSNVHLQELMQLLVAKGGTCHKAKKQIKFTMHRYKEQEFKAFAAFVTFVSKAISTAREYYVGSAGKHIPFLNIGHDGWDSKRKDILGVTVHMVHPVNWVTIALPIGLKHTECKRSEETVAQINMILIR